MVDSVPYSTVLNNGARINANLDIINTLSVVYGLWAPFFVDNSEAVNELIETKSQRIRLVVTEDKTLQMGVDE